MASGYLLKRHQEIIDEANQKYEDVITKAKDCTHLDSKRIQQFRDEESVIENKRKNAQLQTHLDKKLDESMSSGLGCLAFLIIGVVFLLAAFASGWGTAFLLSLLLFAIWCAPRYIPAILQWKKDKEEYESSIARMAKLVYGIGADLKRVTDSGNDFKIVGGVYCRALDMADEQYYEEAAAYKSAVKKAIPVLRKRLDADTIEWMKSDFKAWYKRSYKPATDIFSQNCWSLRVEKAHVTSCTSDTLVFGACGMRPLPELSDRSAMAYVLGRTMKELLEKKFPNLSVTMKYDDNETFIYL